MFTAQERKTLRDYGFNILGTLSSIATSSFLYGIFLLLFCHSTFSVLQRPSRSGGTWVIFSATIISFLLVSLYWASMVAGAFRFVLRQLVYHNQGSKLDSALRLGFDAFQKEELSRVNEVSYWVASIVQLINDCIITWRAWVLCQDRRRLTVVPVFLLICSGVTSLAFLICVSSPEGYYNYTIGVSTRADGLIYTTGALTLTNNILSTSLITYQLWVWRMAWSSGLGGRWSHAQKILLMIIESGAVYIALQLVVAFLFNQDHQPGSLINYVENVAWSGYIHLTAMYATFVLVLINHKRSLSDIECFALTGACESTSNVP